MRKQWDGGSDYSQFPKTHQTLQNTMNLILPKEPNPDILASFGKP